MFVIFSGSVSEGVDVGSGKESLKENILCSKVKLGEGQSELKN